MSVTDLDKVDAIGISPDGKELCMMITDHLDWEDEPTHLMVLQDKINAYLAYLEDGEWKKEFQGDFDNIRIEIAFVYDITENCQKFLQAVQDQLGQYGIRIQVDIADDDLRGEIVGTPETQQKTKRRFPFFRKRK